MTLLAEQIEGDLLGLAPLQTRVVVPGRKDSSPSSRCWVVVCAIELCPPLALGVWR